MPARHKATNTMNQRQCAQAARVTCQLRAADAGTLLNLAIDITLRFRDLPQSMYASSATAIRGATLSLCNKRPNGRAV